MVTVSGERAARLPRQGRSGVEPTSRADLASSATRASATCSGVWASLRSATPAHPWIVLPPRGR
eukprot:15016897-Alexandrium_andersonii.AAC.1